MWYGGYELLRLTTRLTLIVWFVLAAAYPCAAQWTKTIECPAGRVYRDERQHAGREEFCELAFPGSLKVKDGPYRSWFSVGHPGARGNYREGRQVGPWKECDRFDSCRQVKYEDRDANEKQRETFRPTIPVSYARGKYVFDFASCRTTWVSHTKDHCVVDLNIYGMARYRCQITYIPQNGTESGSEEGYFCRIPFSLGLREFDSLDLMSELPRSGLPQFCRPESRTGEAFLVLEKGSDVATTVDVECATLERGPSGAELLSVRLNRYASDLIRNVIANEGPVTALVCLEGVQQNESRVDLTGRAILTYSLSENPAKAARQRKCIARALTIQHNCR
jgi:hypothetical protein